MRYKAEQVTSGTIEGVWEYKGPLWVAYDGEMYFVAVKRECAAENGWYKLVPVVEILVHWDLECADPAANWSEPVSGSAHGSVEALLSQLNSAESRKLHAKTLARGRRQLADPVVGIKRTPGPRIRVRKDFGNGTQ